MSVVAIIDAGYGNLASIASAFARLGAETWLTCDAGEVETCDRLVLPGVGNAALAMARLRELGLVEALRTRTKPLLGICLGMQLLFDASDEEDTPCLGILSGRVTALKPTIDRPVPHMGWSRISEASSGIGLNPSDYVYFAHSFACPDSPATAASADYGRPIPAAVRQGPVWGAQFHPERSALPGENFLKAFLSA